LGQSENSILGAKLYLVAHFKLKFKILLNNILFYSDLAMGKNGRTHSF